MKKKIIMSTLALTMVIGATAHTAFADTATLDAPNQRLGLGRITSMRGYDYVTNILKDKAGLSDEDITNALNSGEALCGIAAENGITQDELKASVFENKAKAIDDAVSKGVITKEEGENLKTSLNTNMENCSGNFGQKQGLGRQAGGRMMGNRQGRGYFYAQNK